MGTREDLARAIMDGADAGRRGDPPVTCPHSAETLLRRAWIRGYARERPVTGPDRTE